MTDVTSSSTVVVTKYYFFGGQRIARRSSVDGYKPFYLHADQLGSTVLESNEAGAVSTDQKYHAYGTQRDSGKVLSEQRFTGQREDDTGLLYMNARYYDPQLGQFLSPDTLVPQPGLFVDYNRYLYGYGNPVKYSDPTGHFSEDQISLLCTNCRTWEDVAAYYGTDAASLLKQESVTFGSIVLAGADEVVTDQYAFVLRGEYDGHQDHFWVALWDLQNNCEASLSDALGHQRVTVWSTDTTLREGGNKYAGWDKGFLDEQAAENWARPSQNGRIDLEGITPHGEFTRYRTYYNLNGWFPVTVVGTAAGIGWQTATAIFSSAVDLADVANEVATSRPWYDSVYPMIYTGNEWVGGGSMSYFALNEPKR